MRLNKKHHAVVLCCFRSSEVPKDYMCLSTNVLQGSWLRRTHRGGRRTPLWNMFVFAISRQVSPSFFVHSREKCCATDSQRVEHPAWPSKLLVWLHSGFAKFNPVVHVGLTLAWFLWKVLATLQKPADGVRLSAATWEKRNLLKYVWHLGSLKLVEPWGASNLLKSVWRMCL